MRRFFETVLIFDVYSDTYSQQSHTGKAQKSGGYCWRIYFKVLEVLFLGEVFPAFLPSKKARGIYQFRHLGVRQQYPGVFRDKDIGLKSLWEKGLLPLY
jgi:hypothetical protein